MRLTTLIAAFLIATVSQVARAQDFIKLLNDQMDVIQNISSKTAIDFNSGSCVDRYRSLFKDGTLNILIGFGYSDSVPGDVVFDWYMVNGLRRVLTGPCRQGVSACEFQAVPGNPDKFIRTIEDADGQVKKVELTLLRASLSGSHKSNISAANSAQQKTLCEAVEKKFYNEMLKGPEIVHYSGHSRNGGAPDFCPPRVRADGHVDYNWYEKNRPGLKQLTSTLAAAKPGTQVLAMHSCSSILHYFKKIRAVKPDLAIIGSSDLVKMSPDFQNQYGGLDALLSLRCEKGLKESMAQGIGMEIHGLFR